MRSIMEFTEKEYEILENSDFKDDYENSYIIITKSDDVKTSDLAKVVSVIDQKTGKEIFYTYSKFLEIFDSKGLESFI